MRTMMMLALPLLLASCGKEDAKPPTHDHSGMDHSAMPGGGTDQAKDMVCKMWVDKTKAKKEAHEGADYYFCSDNCMAKFKAEPKKYAVHCSCPGMKRACACNHCGGKEPCDCVK